MLNFGLSRSDLSISQKATLDSIESNAFLSFEEVGKELIRSIGLLPAAQFVSFFLQKTYQEKRDLSQVFAAETFAFCFAKVILEEVKYPNFENSKQIFEQLEIIGKCRANRNQSGIPLKNSSNIRKSKEEIQAEENLNQYFGEIHEAVVALFLPFYHHLVLESQEEGKKQFIDLFFERFVSRILLNSPTHVDGTKDETRKRSFTGDVKLAYVQNAKSIISILIDALDNANAKYSDVKVNPSHFAAFQNIMNAHQKLSEFKAQLTQVHKSVLKLSENVLSYPWSFIYQETIKNISELLAKLNTETVANTEQAETLIKDTMKDVLVNLAPITGKPVKALSIYATIESRLVSPSQRVKDLKDIFSLLQEIFAKAPLIKESYENVNKGLTELLENLILTLIHNSWQLEDETIVEEIDKFHKNISSLIGPFINQSIVNLTMLQRVVMMKDVPSEKLKDYIVTLLREGADKSVTTTEYEKEGGMFSRLLSGSKKPLDVKALAQLYNTSETYFEAMSVVEAEESNRIEQAYAHVKDLAQSEKPAPTLATEAPEPPAVTLNWKRGEKRDKPERTPPVTPRAAAAAGPTLPSPREHDDKKVKTGNNWVSAKKSTPR